MHTVFDFAAKRAELAPDAVAFEEVESGRRLTFTQFNDRAARGAAALAQLGITAGERVAILCHNCATFFEVLFACGKANIILVPLNWRQTPAELTPILADCGASLILHDAATAGLATALGTASGAKLIDFAAYETLIAGSPPPRRGRVRGGGKGARHRLAHQPRLVPALYLRHHRPAQGRDPDGRHGARQHHQRAAGD